MRASTEHRSAAIQHRSARVGTFLLLAILPRLAPAQQLVVTTEDYVRAEQFMSWKVNPLVYNIGLRPTWLPDGRFWYRTQTAKGFEFIVVDPARRTRIPAFDQARLATTLATAADTAYDAYHLPFTAVDFSADGRTISFDTRARHWTCDIQGIHCTADSSRAALRNAIASPDGKLAAFIRDYNLWVRDLATGQERQLTTDGIQDFGYATDNAGWTRSDRPVLLWSPDSRMIATFQHDARHTGEMYLVETRVGHPVLSAWKYPLPGDSTIFTIQRVIIHLDGPRVVRLQVPADPHRSTLCDHVFCNGRWADVEWSADSRQLAFVSTSRNHQHEQLRIADAGTGAIREVFDETVPTFFESGNGRVNWHLLAASNEV
ncbi:MAG: DPP IV N-terminal domain-containing protein, partial [Gemmatimonadota bacterium]